jgi:hypothetical protein
MLMKLTTGVDRKGLSDEFLLIATFQFEYIPSFQQKLFILSGVDLRQVFEGLTFVRRIRSEASLLLQLSSTHRVDCRL